MLTQKVFTVPERAATWEKSYDDLVKAIKDHFNELNRPGSLEIYEATFDGTVGATTPSTGAFTTISASGQITSTVATGSAPLVVASTTKVTNLNADFLDDQSGAYYQNAGNLNAGTIPDARFPATLPAASGANLTALNASNLSTGTVGDGRLSARVNSSPAVTAGSGTFTTVSASLNRQRVGDSIIWDLSVTITTNGTAATQINVAMPFTASYECVAAGREAATTGAACTGTMNASSSTLQIVKYDNTYPGADGYRITLSGRTFVN